MSDGPHVKWEPAGSGLSIIPTPSVGTITMAGNAQDEHLYLFLDESGDFDFGPYGSSHFYMTCVAARRPLTLDAPLADLRYDVLEKGVPIEKFHACEDNSWVKTEVYKRIAAHAERFDAYSIRINKSEVPTEMRSASELYARVFQWITDEVYDREVRDGTKMVIVVTDSLSQAAKSRQVDGPLKRYMKRRFQGDGIPYQLLHHPSCAWAYLQVADYLSWAVQRLYSHGKDWPLRNVRESFREMGEVSFGEMEEGDSRRKPPSDLPPIS